MSATTLQDATLDERNDYIIEGLAVLSDLLADQPAALIAMSQLGLAYQDFVEQVNDEFGTTLDVASTESRQELQDTVYSGLGAVVAAVLADHFGGGHDDADSQTVQV